MPESTVESSPAGLRVIADVAAVFSAGLVTEDALSRVVVVLRRGLDLVEAGVWLRRTDRSGYELIPRSFDPAAQFLPTSEWFKQEPERERIAGGGGGCACGFRSSSRSRDSEHSSCAPTADARTSRSSTSGG